MRKILVIALLLLVPAVAYSHPLFLRVYGTITPVNRHNPISILDDFGFTRLEIDPGLGGSAGLELEWVLPIESELGISVLLGSGYIFPKKTFGLDYSYIPIYLAAKVSLKILLDYPWSLYLITRAGYNFFLIDPEYRDRSFVYREIDQVGGVYFNVSLGSEVLLFGPISLLTEIGYDMSSIFTEPAFIVLGETKRDIENRLNILVGISIDL